MRAEAPADWDLPARSLGEPVAVVAREVPEAEKERLRAEEDSHALPANAVRAVVAMLEAVANPTDPTTFRDVAGFVGEVRDFLLADGQVAHLTDLVRALGDESRLAPETAAPILATFADGRAIGKILHSLPKGAETAPPPLLALLDLLPADHLGHLIDLLGEERSETRRRCARSLIERYAPKQPEELVRRLRSAEPAVVRDLLRVCAHALPERAVESARELALHPDDGVALEALWILSEAPHSPAVGRALVRMLESSSTEIRLRVVEVLAKRKEHAAFDPLARHVERRVHRSMTTREAETYGQALARLAPDAALALFEDWTHERRLVERLVPMPHDQLLRWAAVAGLGVLPGEKPAQLVRKVADQSDDALRGHCEAVLARREKHRG
jgi:HEAT repeat protein